MRKEDAYIACNFFYSVCPAHKVKRPLPIASLSGRDASGCSGLIVAMRTEDQLRRHGDPVVAAVGCYAL
ncbi:hypothetical protein VTO42DRAFT_1075 [Malbranchea cinnamomea]